MLEAILLPTPVTAVVSPQSFEFGDRPPIGQAFAQSEKQMHVIGHDGRNEQVDIDLGVHFTQDIEQPFSRGVAGEYR